MPEKSWQTCIKPLLLLSLFAATAVGDQIILSFAPYRSDLFSESFRAFDIDVPEECDQSINTCLHDIHAEAYKCIRHWRTHSSKYIEECRTNEDVQTKAKKFRDATDEWHRTVDRCLQGDEEVPTLSPEEDTFMLFLRRRKRDHHGGSGYHTHHQSVDACFDKTRQLTISCTEKITQCPKLAMCFGIGITTDAEGDQDWRTTVKQLRERVERTKQQYKAELDYCIRRKGADDLAKSLKDFGVLELSEPFQMFNLSQPTCHRDVWNCLSDIHQHAKLCVDLQHKELKQKSANYEECSDKDEIKTARRDWEGASGKWHMALDQCLRGESLPEEESAFFFLRRKRSTSEEEDDYLAPTRPKIRVGLAGGTRTFATAEECWQDADKHKRLCRDKVLGCQDYAVCSGGEIEKVPAEKKDWHDYSQRLRNEQKQKHATYRRELFDCLELPQPGEQHGP